MKTHAIELDLAWSDARVLATLDAIEQIEARIDACPHRWTLAPLVGWECANCPAFSLELPRE